MVIRRREGVLRKPSRWLSVLGVAALLTPLAACSSGGPAPKPTAPSVSPPVTGSVEQVAARLGCKPVIRTEAEELREGRCPTAAGEFHLKAWLPWPT